MGSGLVSKVGTQCLSNLPAEPYDGALAGLPAAPCEAAVQSPRAGVGGATRSEEKSGPWVVGGSFEGYQGPR